MGGEGDGRGLESTLGGWVGGAGGGVVVHLAPPFAPTTRKF